MAHHPAREPAGAGRPTRVPASRPPPRARGPPAHAATPQSPAFLCAATSPPGALGARALSAHRPRARRLARSRLTTYPPTPLGAVLFKHMFKCTETFEKARFSMGVDRALGPPTLSGTHPPWSWMPDGLGQNGPRQAANGRALGPGLFPRRSLRHIASSQLGPAPSDLDDSRSIVNPPAAGSQLGATLHHQLAPPTSNLLPLQFVFSFFLFSPVCCCVSPSLLTIAGPQSTGPAFFESGLPKAFPSSKVVPRVWCFLFCSLFNWRVRFIFSVPHPVNWRTTATGRHAGRSPSSQRPPPGARRCRGPRWGGVKPTNLAKVGLTLSDS